MAKKLTVADLENILSKIEDKTLPVIINHPTEGGPQLSEDAYQAYEIEIDGVTYFCIDAIKPKDNIDCLKELGETCCLLVSCDDCENEEECHKRIVERFKMCGQAPR